MEEVIYKKTVLRAPVTGSKPCMRCQFGIFDIPEDGKLNCFEAGTSSIKIFTKDEVESMTSCEKMVQWSKMELNNNDAEKRLHLKVVDKLLGNQHD